MDVVENHKVQVLLVGVENKFPHYCRHRRCLEAEGRKCLDKVAVVEEGGIPGLRGQEVEVPAGAGIREAWEAEEKAAEVMEVAGTRQPVAVATARVCMGCHIQRTCYCIISHLWTRRCLLVLRLILQHCLSVAQGLGEWKALVGLAWKCLPYFSTNFLSCLNIEFEDQMCKFGRRSGKMGEG